MVMFWKSWMGGGGGGGTAFMIPYLICKLWPCSEKVWPFVWPQSLGVGGGGGGGGWRDCGGGGGGASAEKISATMLPNSWFPLIWYANYDHVLKKSWTLPPGSWGVGVGVGGGVCGQNICFHVAAFMILFNLIGPSVSSQALYHWATALPSRVTNWEPKVWQNGRRRLRCRGRHDPYVSTMLRRRHKKCQDNCDHLHPSVCPSILLYWRQGKTPHLKVNLNISWTDQSKVMNFSAL